VLLNSHLRITTCLTDLTLAAYVNGTDFSHIRLIVAVLNKWELEEEGPRAV